MSNVREVCEVKGNSCLTHGQKINAHAADDSTSYIWIKPEEILLSAEAFPSSARNQFKCRVTGWDFRRSLLAVQIIIGELSLTSLITHDAFKELDIKVDAEFYATFKSSAVHCF